MFVIKVDKVITSVTQSEKMTSGSVNAYVVEFQFSEEWASLTKVAVFRANADTPFNILLDGTDRCLIPYNVLTTKGSKVEVGVYGTRGEEIVLPTIWTDIGTLLEGVVEGIYPPSPTPDIYQQILLRYDYLATEIENLKNGWTGEPGVGGGTGVNGKSAYELAVEQGFEGTLDEWLESLKGDPGKDGLDGKDAIINGVSTLEIKAGSNIEINQNGSILTISAASSSDSDSVGMPEGSIPIKPLTADAYNDLPEEDKNSETGWLITSSDNGNTSVRSNLGEMELRYKDKILSGITNGSQEPSAEVYLVKAPVGSIVIWSGTEDNVPDKWALCDGQDGRPDLRDKFVLASGPNHPVGDTGGEEEVSLTVQQLPAHTHNISTRKDSTVGNTEYVAASGTNGTYSPRATTSVGNGLPHSNMPPYYSLCYIIKIASDETDSKDGLSAYEIAVKNGFEGNETDWLESLKGQAGRDGSDGNDGVDGSDGKDATINGFNAVEIKPGDNIEIAQSEDTITISSAPSINTYQYNNAPVGSIIMWGKSIDDIPEGWHICDGEDGTIDLRDKFVLASGPNHPVGDTGGEEEVTLSVDEIPSHSHTGMIIGHSGLLIEKDVTTPNSLAAASFAYRAFTSDATGGGEAHNNMPPYYSIIFIQKISESPTDGITEERLNEALSSISTKDVYSTDEQVVGTWIDGTPIYRIVIETTSPSNTDTAIVGKISNFSKITKLYGIMYHTGYGDWYPLPFVGTGTDSISLYIKKLNIYCKVFNSLHSNMPVTIIVEYTKPI